MKLAVFLERDGVLNHSYSVNGRLVAPLRLAEFQLNAHAAPLLHPLKRAGFLVIVTAHQPGLALGLQSRRDLDQMHQWLLRAMPIDDIFVCPHDVSSGCDCCKPNPGLYAEAAFKWDIDLSSSFVISNDPLADEAARRAGCHSFVIESPGQQVSPREFQTPSLQYAVEEILRSPRMALT